MRKEAKALFLLAIMCLQSALSLDNLPDPTHQAKLKILKQIKEDLKNNEVKLQQKILSALSAINFPEAKIDQLSYEVKTPAIKVSGSASGVLVSTLPTLKISNVDINLMKGTLSVEMEVDELMVSGQYSLSGRYWTQTVQSEGTFNIDLRDVKLTGSGKLKIGSELSLESMDFKLDFGVVKESFDGLLKSKDLNKSLSKSILEAMTSPGLNEHLAKTMVPVIKQSISGLTHCSLAECSLSPSAHTFFLSRSHANINKEIEELLILVSERISDPWPLPDFGIEFGFWPFILKVGLFEGFLEGLSNMFRASDWTLDTDGEKAGLIEGILAVIDLKGGYKFVAKYMGIGVDMYTTTEIAYIDIDMAIDIDLVECVMTLTKMQAVNIVDIVIETDDWIFVDWIIELILEGITWIFLDLIVIIIEDMVTNIVEEILVSIDVCKNVLPSVMPYKL